MQQLHEVFSSAFCTRHVWHVHFGADDDDDESEERSDGSAGAG